MIAVKQAVNLMRDKIAEGKPAEALTVLDTHEERLAFKYATLSMLAGKDSNREQMRKYHRLYRHALRRLD